MHISSAHPLAIKPHSTTPPNQVMCLSIDVPTDKSYTFVIPVPSFRAPDAIHSDIKVFNFI